MERAPFVARTDAVSEGRGRGTATDRRAREREVETEKGTLQKTAGRKRERHFRPPPSQKKMVGNSRCEEGLQTKKRAQKQSSLPLSHFPTFLPKGFLYFCFALRERPCCTEINISVLRSSPYLHARRKKPPPPLMFGTLLCAFGREEENILESLFSAFSLPPSLGARC